MGIRPAGGWGDVRAHVDAQEPVMPQICRVPARSRLSVFAGALKWMAVISILLGVAGTLALSSKRPLEVPFPVQVLADAAIVFIGLMVVYLYFMPTMYALQNRKRLVIIIAVLNFFFGWTIIGWWILVAWGATPEKEDWQGIR
jgi:hypothetical protein